MKKITFLILMLFTASLTFAQVGISENFDSGTPAGWTDDYSNSANGACAGNSERGNIWGSNTTGNLTSPNQVGLSNGTDLTVSFDYKIVDYNFANPTVATVPGWGTADIQYSTDDGTTWVTAVTIDDSNHVTSAACAPFSVVIPAASLPTGSDVKLQVANTFGGTGDYYFYVDNFSATQVVATPPNCDAVLTQTTDVPLNGNISWNAATGIPTGYFITAGTTSGGTDIANNVDVGNTTSYSLGTLTSGATYYVTILPYNANGNATGCTEQTLTAFVPPAGDDISIPIAITPSPEETVCDTAEYPFSYDFTSGYTDSGLDDTCTTVNTGLDIFFSWTATSDALIWNDGGGNPGIAIRDAATGNLITCVTTFAALDFVLSGWTVGQDLILQVYDFGAASVNPLSFCLAEFNLPTAPDCVTDPMPEDETTDIAAGTVTLSWTAATTGPAVTSYDVYSGLLADFSDQALRGNTTTTTFDLTGVGFNQTVYWRVVPKNGPSENTGCDYWSFTSADAPTGALCTDPIVVASLPYNEAAGTTNGFGDDYTGSPGATSCGTTSGYLNGDDIVYSYTATSDTQISINMTPAGTWSGIFVYADCADIGTACLAGIGNSGTGIREIDLDVTNGTTYYIVISTFAAPQSVDYVLDIFENTCSDSVATYTVVNDCDVSGGFLIDVEITDMGTATDLTVSNDQDATTFAVTAVGTVQFGPFVNATDVVITVADDNDAVCTYSSAALTQAVCPPSNDDIANATPITIGEMICDGTTNNGTNEGATDSGEGAGTCYVGGAGSDVWYTFTVATDSSVIVSTDYLGGTLVDTQIAIFSGTPGSLTQVACSQDEGVVTLSNGSSWNSLITDQAVTAGTYYVQVSGYNGAEGTFCLSVDLTPIANDECAGAEALTFGVEVSADNTGATDSMVTGDCFTGNIADLWYSFVAGAGGEVTITTTAAQYGVYSDCTGTQVGACNTSTVTGLTDGATYYVRVSDDGTARAQAPGAFTLTVMEPTAGLDEFNADSLFSYYPNPVSNNLTLNAQKDISNVSVYNMIGQEVYRNAPNSVNNTVDMSNLQSGAYFVKVTIDNVTETIKVIKK